MPFCRVSPGESFAPKRQELQISDGFAFWNRKTQLPESLPKYIYKKIQKAEPVFEISRENLDPGNAYHLDL